jgi:cobalamin biosynthesis protein CobD/CbiB
VETLANGYLDAGVHTLIWDASNSASGVYLYRLTTDNKVLTKKMLLTK